MTELTKLIVDNYGELHKLAQEVTHLLTPQEAEARSFFEEHRAGMTKENILHGLWYINRTPYFKKSREQIADNLLCIPDLFQRVNDGSLDVLAEVAAAFCIGRDLRISHVQCAMTFCALINPAQFPRFDNAVFSLMCADKWDISQFVRGGIVSDVAEVIGIASLVKNFYDAIKDNVQDCNYADIHSVLTTIWKVLTDPRVIDAAVTGILRGGSKACGLPDCMSNLLSKLISMGVMDLLRPKLEAYRKRQFKYKHS